LEVLDEAVELIEAARPRGIPLRLVGGLAVRYVCPNFPPRVREDQDLDLASTSAARKELVEFLSQRGFEADKRFNALYGHKQLYFQWPDGRTLDVLVDRMDMCHELEFADRLDRMPFTLDLTDLLLTKLQIVELNEKDVQDIVYLLSAWPVKEGDEPGTIGLERIRSIVGSDWGWWRTLTLNLDRIEQLVGDGDLVPGGADFDPVEQLRTIREAADSAPKSLRWRVRAKVGERKRWYRLPEETGHD
jgi:hypothetical protein